MAAPAPALSDNSDCVLAESAETGRVPLTKEAAIQSEASSVPEWGADHCHGTEEGGGDASSDAPGRGDAPGDAPRDTPGGEEEELPVVVAAPVPALGDNDCVLAGPKF